MIDSCLIRMSHMLISRRSPTAALCAEKILFNSSAVPKTRIATEETWEIGINRGKTKGWEFAPLPRCGMPIGMSPVSSVTFEPTLKEGVRVRKGDMMGHFLFGGSDFVMVFQAGYDFTLDSPRSDKQDYSRLLMGERLGRLQHVSGARH